MNTLSISTDKHLLRVRLNRPDKRNAFNAEMITELFTAFDSLAPTIRAVLIHGEGPVFCAGADLGWMASSAQYSREQNLEDATRMAHMFHAIARCPAPVLAFAHGAALGGAVGLLSCADIVVATRSCKFGVTEVRLGLVPAVISPFVMSKIGASWARRLFLTGETFTAERALQCGLVHDLVEDGKGPEVLEPIAESICKNGPEAVRIAKSLVFDVPRAADPTALTARTIAERRVSLEAQEGVRAFFEKRPPSWTA